MPPLALAIGLPLICVAASFGAITEQQLLDELKAVSRQLEDESVTFQARVHVHESFGSRAKDRDYRITVSGRQIAVHREGNHAGNSNEEMWLLNHDYVASVARKDTAADFGIVMVAPQLRGNPEILEVANMEANNARIYVLAGWMIHGRPVWTHLERPGMKIEGIRSVTHEGADCLKVDWSFEGKSGEWRYRETDSYLILDPNRSWGLQEFRINGETFYDAVTQLDVTQAKLEYGFVANGLHFCKNLDLKIVGAGGESQGGWVSVLKTKTDEIDTVQQDPNRFRLAMLGMPEPDLASLRGGFGAQRLVSRGLIFLLLSLVLFGLFYYRKNWRHSH